MKSCSTKFLSLYFFLIILAVGTQASAQISPDKKDDAFYSDFYVMQVRPMKFQLTYNWPATDRVLVRISDGNRNYFLLKKYSFTKNMKNCLICQHLWMVNTLSNYWMEKEVLLTSLTSKR